MAGEVGGRSKGQVTRIQAQDRQVTPEDVWNAAIRAGADPARLALSLSHVLGEADLPVDGDEYDAVAVHYLLKSGQELAYDASLHNPFHNL
jgi:hypothetical protein